MENKVFDIIYIGMGPGTIFSLLANPDLSKKKILVLEKGKSIENRNPKEVLFGSGGAGAFSDSKLVSNPLVGGDIRNLININDELFYNLSDDILNYYQKFSDHDCRSCLVGKCLFQWLPEDNYEIPSDKLKLLKSRVCHIGTDNSKMIFKNIEEYLKTKYEIHFEEEVLNIEPIVLDWHSWDGKTLKEPQGLKIVTSKREYLTKKVIIGVGKRSSLVTDLVKQLGLKSKNNLCQIGVRVETPMNEKLQELVTKFYDFKIVQETKLGRWRTFCCCAKDAYVAVEKNEEFVSANGAANSSKGNNGLVNFGIMGELNLNLSREKQIELMQKINDGTDKLLAQNINDFLTGLGSLQLNCVTTVSREEYRLANIWNYLPLEILWELRDFIWELKECFGIHGHFLAPEIKLTNPIIEMNGNFEIYPGIHLIGDCSGYTRSIIQSAITGILVGKYLNK